MKASMTWYEKCTTDREKEQMRADLMAALPALKELRKILESRQEASRKARMSKNTYDCPSWPFLQADAVGEERAYETIIKLISIKVEE